MAKRKAVDEEPQLDDRLEQTECSDPTPRRSRRRKYSDEERISEVNALSANRLKKQYIDAELLVYSTEATETSKDYRIDLKTSGDLTNAELNSCFQLIESTSRPDYESSPSWGWYPKRKRREMKEDEMRYLLVRSASRTQGSRIAADQPVLGFLSFMLTHDSTPNVPVLYVYEIHLSQALRRLGLGAHLMDLAESIAENVAMQKVMLTCFLSNKAAHSFYRKRGYVADSCSPEDRRTRNKVIKADYVIMSKEVLGSSSRSAVEGEIDVVVRDPPNRTPSTANEIAADNALSALAEWRTSLKHNSATNIGESSSYVPAISAPGKVWQMDNDENIPKPSHLPSGTCFET
jgi:ribosomal protein S18 acetylase RimI-like enzyme